MVSSDNRYGRWPASGEIDIAECVGWQRDVVHASVHTESYNHRLKNHKSAQMKVNLADETYKMYSLTWTPSRITVGVDGEDYFEFVRDPDPPNGSSKTWPFDHDFHLILNVAVGGNWGGKCGIAEDACPATMMVSSVRVFELAG